jgi:glyoxylase-like metal-dependent hydrolase (beta-lactamase superfamily II)
MTIVHAASGTNVHEIASGIYRISVPVPPGEIPGGFTFNQFLIVDDAPLLFHTGLKNIFPLVMAAVDHVLGSANKLRYVGFSHFESDECGALNEWLTVAPQAEAVCSRVAAMVSVGDFAQRPPRALADGEELTLGKKRVRWLDAPHLPHNWECGYMFEATERTLLCGDLFTHAGSDVPPTTTSDVVGPAEAMRNAMPASFAIEAGARGLLEKLARTEPTTLALMHGSSFSGNGARALLDLATALGV